MAVSVEELRTLGVTMTMVGGRLEFVKNRE
jgi:hypothetical protein